MEKDLHVLIIGAGSTGLLIGQGLKHAGISHTVFERDEEFYYKERPRTWTMGLHWGIEAVRKCLPEELIADWHMVDTDPTLQMTDEELKAIPFVNGKTGEVAAMMPADSTRRVSRHKMRALMGRGLDVRYGKRLRKIDDDGTTITAHFEDGTSAQGNLLIGCDGAKSAVRSHLVSPEANELHVMTVRPVNITQRYTAEQALFIKKHMHHPVYEVSPHPDQPTVAFLSTAEVLDPGKPETWLFQLHYSYYTEEDQLPTSEERMKFFKAWAANYCEPLRSAALWIKEDTFIPPDRYTQWLNITKWDNRQGRITLSGDAAHPMSPFRGQGLNNALEDATLYVETVKSYVSGAKELSSAMNDYDDQVYARGKQEIEISQKQLYASHHWEHFMTSPMVTNQTGMKRLAVAKERRRQDSLSTEELQV